ncbi:MAG: IS5 family transposase [Saprospiraceae bacterium]|jgi:IS5 family transposase
MLQAVFFDLEDRFKKIDEKDKLVALNTLIDWEAFRPALKGIEKVNRKSNAGRKRKGIVMMFKILVLPHLYNLSDDELDFQIRDRYSFCRCLGLRLEETVPDAKPFWDFRQSVVDHDLVKKLFEQFDKQIKKGKIPDSFK